MCTPGQPYASEIEPVRHFFARPLKYKAFNLKPCNFHIRFASERCAKISSPNSKPVRTRVIYSNDLWYIANAQPKGHRFPKCTKIPFRERDTSTKIAIYLEIPVSRSGMSNHLRFFMPWGSTFRRPHDQESFVRSAVSNRKIQVTYSNIKWDSFNNCYRWCFAIVYRHSCISVCSGVVERSPRLLAP